MEFEDHKQVIQDIAGVEEEDDVWDLYLQALAVQERTGVAAVGATVDRRAFDATLERYSDTKIKALVCFVCGRVCLDTGATRCEIEYCRGEWLATLPAGSLVKNWSEKVFCERYPSPITDLEEWRVTWHEDVVARERARLEAGEIQRSGVLDIGGSYLLCCPEDQISERTCKAAKKLCRECQIPMCVSCQLSLRQNRLFPTALLNDDFIGYLDPWMYRADITWMETEVATPFWAGMTLFAIDRRATHRRQKHNLLDTACEGKGRALLKGQLFSAPMDWAGILEQLKKNKEWSAHLAACAGRSVGCQGARDHRGGTRGSQQTPEASDGPQQLGGTIVSHAQGRRPP